MNEMLGVKSSAIRASPNCVGDFGFPNIPALSGPTNTRRCLPQIIRIPKKNRMIPPRGPTLCSDSVTSNDILFGRYESALEIPAPIRISQLLLLSESACSFAPLRSLAVRQVRQIL